MSVASVWLCGVLLSTNAPAVPAAGSPDAVAALLRTHLIKAMPAVLYEARPGWGTQKTAFRGVKWRGDVVPLRPEVQRGPQNDGTWRHVRLTTGKLDESLVLNLRDLTHPEPGRTTFNVFLAFPTRVEFTQQHWKSGLKLYDGSVRARCRVLLTLHCELTSRVETEKGLPAAVLRVRVTRADLRYDHLVVEHIAGVGGELAQVVGKALHDGMRQWRPSMERDLLAKANAAIVKAGDTGEVTVGLKTLLNPKSLTIRPKVRPLTPGES